MLDIERPRWFAAVASKAASIGNPGMIRKWQQDGLTLGKYKRRTKSGGWLSSTLDTRRNRDYKRSSASAQ
jgi:hypothetical protein